MIRAPLAALLALAFAAPAKALEASAAKVDIIKAPTVTKEKERRFTRPTDSARPECGEIDVVEIEREINDGGSESHSETASKESVAPPVERSKTRYAGLLFGPYGFGGSWVEGARGGLTLHDTWDLGGSLRRERDGGLRPGGDITFRW